MYEVVVTILIFIGVIAVTVVLFAGWLVVSLMRGLTRLLMGTSRPSARGQALFAATSPDRIRCARARCHAENPQRGRFCRRCGYSLEAGATPQHAHVRHRPRVRQAAML